MKKQYIAPAAEAIDFVGDNLLVSMSKISGDTEDTGASEALSNQRSIWSDNKDGQSAWGGSAWDE